jgi:S-formylglutathione hydrolase FrmB
MELSLVSGAVPVLSVVLGVASLILAFEFRRGVWRRQVRVAVPAVAAVLAAAIIAVEGLGLIPWGFPDEAYLWVAAVLLAVAAALAGWRAFPPWRRAVAPIPVVLTALMAAVLVNQYFHYFPSVGSLLGRNAPHEISMDELHRLREANDGTAPEHGYTVRLPIPGTVSGFDARNSTVWVPPVWFVDRTVQLPVIMLLAGVPGSPTDWTRAGFAAQTADSFARRQGGQAPLIVMPDANGSMTGDTECVDSRRGAAETYLTRDVPSAMQATFGTAPPGPQWAVGGLSAGGTCAMTLALRNPGLYSAFADYSGLTSPTVADAVDPAATTDALFGGSEDQYDAHDPLWLLSERTFPSLAAWFQVGTSDPGPLAAQRRLVPLAQEAGLQVCHAEVRGGRHAFDVWARSFEDSLPWLAARLGSAPEPRDVAATCVAPK